MAVINYPVLEFKSSLDAFLNFANTYNQDKPLGEQLRPQHSKMFARILTLTSRQLYQQNKLFNDTPEFRQINSNDPLTLSTNRKALSWVEKTIKINENTAYRHVNRLIKAGVINEKINHGSQMNFELLINPDFLLISDHSNPDFKPVSKYLENADGVSSDCLRTSCLPEYLTPEKELINNSNITVDKECRRSGRHESVKELERTQKKNLMKEHGEISQNKNVETNVKKEISEQCSKLFEGWNQKEHQIAPANESKLRMYQKAAARWFFWYVLHVLFDGRIFNPGHLENTLAYVERYYFTNCHSLQAIENTRKLFKWRVDKARGTIERKNINTQWIFPGSYLDLSKKGINQATGKPHMSFINTASWPGKYENLLKQKQKDKNQYSDQDVLNKQFRLFLNNPNLNQFKRCEAHVKKNIPHLMGDFLSHFSTTKIFAHA